MAPHVAHTSLLRILFDLTPFQRMLMLLKGPQRTSISKVKRRLLRIRRHTTPRSGNAGEHKTSVWDDSEAEEKLEHISRAPAGPQSPLHSLGAIMDLCTETEPSSSQLAAKVLKLIPKKTRHLEESLRNVITHLDCVQVHHSASAKTISWKLICALLKDVFPSVDIEEVIRQHVEKSSIGSSDKDTSAAATHDRQGHKTRSHLLPRLRESLRPKHLPQATKAVRSRTISSCISSSPELEKRLSPRRSTRWQACRTSGQREAGTTAVSHSRSLHGGISDSSGKQGRNSDSPHHSPASGTRAGISQKREWTSERDDRCSEDSEAEAGRNVRSSLKHVTGSSSCQSLEKRQNPVEKHSAQQIEGISHSTPKVSSPSVATSEKNNVATFMMLPIFRRYPVVELERLAFVGTSSEETGSNDLAAPKKKPMKTASEKKVPFLPSCLSSSPHSNRKTMLAKARERSDTSAGSELSSKNKTVSPLSTLPKTRRAVFVDSEDVTLTESMEPVKSPMDTIKNPSPSPGSSHFLEARVCSEGKRSQPRKQKVGRSRKIPGTKSLAECALDARERTETSIVASSGEDSSSTGPSSKEARVSERCELSGKSSQSDQTSRAKGRTAPEELAESQNILVDAVAAKNRDSVQSGKIPEKRLETGLHDGPPSSSEVASLNSPSTSDHFPTKRPSDSPWVKSKSKRMRFTPLQEEALVRGVMKYGTGSWKLIADEGWFDGRVSRELSDKYRNLQKYDHLSRVRARVKEKLKQGIDPMKELQVHNRSIYNTRRVSSHSVQPDILPSERIQAASSVAADARVPQTEGRDATAGVERGARGKSPIQPCVSESREHRTDCEPGPELPHSARNERTHERASERASERRDEPLPLVSGAHLQDSPLDSDTEVSSDDSWTSKPVQPVPKKRRRNCFFSPLEEAALVSGVLRYGTGRWSAILTEGWFSGRNGVQLSDKYRNMTMYGHWERMKREVEKKLGTPDDPLLQLKELNKAHWRSSQ